MGNHILELLKIIIRLKMVLKNKNVKLLKIYNLENFIFLLPTKKEITELKNSILRKEL